MGIVADIIILLFVSFFGAVIAQRLKQPLILGYILAGVAVSAFSGGSLIGNAHEIETLAEIGVALLLFSLGLESFIPKLKAVSKISLIGTPIQVAVTMIGGYCMGRWFGWNSLQSIWWGAMITFSSTLVVLKTLGGMGLFGTLSSQVMLGILIMQDILVIPMLIFLPLLNDPNFTWSIVFLSLGKGILFVVVMYYLGRQVFPKLLGYIAQWNSRELFLLTVVTLGLGVGYVTYLIGLPFAFGAFVAGIVLNDSDYGHQAFSEILPVRDLFALLFFTSIGLLIQPRFLWDNLQTILFLVLLVSILKMAVLMCISRAFGYRNIVPLAVGFGLFQVGEFSFVLARIGLNLQAVDSYMYSLILSTSLLTIVLTPLASYCSQPIYSFFRKRRPINLPIEKSFKKENAHGHVIIAGGGRVGQHIGQLLQHLEIQFVIIEINYQRVLECKEAGLPFIYGDSTNITSLEAAGMKEATLLLITTPALLVAETMVQNVKLMNPKICIIARADGIEQMQKLHQTGVETVVMPEMEGGLEIAKQAFLQLGLPLQLIQHYSDQVRKQLYLPFYDGNRTSQQASSQADFLPIADIRNWLEVAWFALDEKSIFVGKKIKDLKISSETGALVVGVMQRGKDFLANPKGDYIFQVGDQVAIVANQEEKQNYIRFASATHL